MIGSNIILIIYLLLWIILYAWYRRQDTFMDGGSLILLTYIGYAVFSIISFNNLDAPKRYPYLPLHLGAILFLFGMLMLALSPTIYHRKHPLTKQPEFPAGVVLTICWIFILSGFLDIATILVSYIHNIKELFTDSEAGQQAYIEALSMADESGSGINDLFSIIYNMLYDLCAFFLFYLLINARKHKLVLIALFMALLIGIATPIMHGQRGISIISLLTLAMSFFIFQRFYPERQRMFLKKLGIGFVIVIMLPIAAVTKSRFGQDNVTDATNSLVWYIGQGNIYFCNYAINDGGTREGTRVFNLACRLINPDTPANFYARRDMYSNLEIGDEVFSTFVGDFVIDLGIPWAIIVFVVFNALVLWLIKRNETSNPSIQLLITYVTMCICMQGGMTLFSYADTAGLKLVAFAIVIIALYVCDYFQQQKTVKQLPINHDQLPS